MICFSFFWLAVNKIIIYYKKMRVVRNRGGMHAEIASTTHGYVCNIGPELTGWTDAALLNEFDLFLPVYREQARVFPPIRGESNRGGNGEA